MDEDVSVWEGWLAVVSVRDADHGDWVHERLGGNSSPPGVELAGEEDARLGDELLPEPGPWTVEQRVEARMLLSAKERHAGFRVRIGCEKPRECWTTRDYLESLSLQMYLRNLARNRHSEPTILENGRLAGCQCKKAHAAGIP
jgi:hypothetical protein